MLLYGSAAIDVHGQVVWREPKAGRGGVQSGLQTRRECLSPAHSPRACPPHSNAVRPTSCQQPTIIFLDEVDAFLRSRQSTDNESSAQIKAQFMSLWDGFSSDGPGKVVIVGATNRPNDVDRAILRRMPRTFRIGLPGLLQRESILKALLRKERIEGTYDLTAIATGTEGYSGNDLQELCRNAAMTAMTKRLRRQMRGGSEDRVGSRDEPLQLTTDDFLNARSAVEATQCEPDSMDLSESFVDRLD